MSDEFWRLVSFVRRSKNRRKVVAALDRSQSPLTPTDLATRTNIGLPNTCRALKQLREQELVKCVNPDDHTYRHYILTDQGETILAQVKVIEDETKAETTDA